MASALLSFQNTFLQETVRRECEERFELTEALSEAKQQLLGLRKLSASSALSPCSPDEGSPAACAAAVGSHGERSLVSGVRIPRLHGVSKPTRASASQNPTRASSSGLPLLPQPHLPRGQALSVNETRRRLAAMLRRRLSQQ